MKENSRTTRYHGNIPPNHTQYPVPITLTPIRNPPARLSLILCIHTPLKPCIPASLRANRAQSYSIEPIMSPSLPTSYGLNGG